mmetsp:Transcript_27699/g.53864  ORF Transcript_27699/g.53864 Transcript_27699/m.53864 type:complete len:115 (-) Transcript_27699:312-656(-)
MELEAFSRLDTPSIHRLVDMFYSLELSDAQTRRRSIRRMRRRLGLPKHGKLSSEICSCFEEVVGPVRNCNNRSVVYSSSVKERLEHFISVMSFALAPAKQKTSTKAETPHAHTR